MHSFQEKQIRDACAVEYPCLIDDIKTPPTDRGLLSFVSDQIFELDFLDKEDNETREEDSNTSAPAQADDVENLADLDDDKAFLFQDLEVRGDHSIHRYSTVSPLSMSPQP